MKFKTQIEEIFRAYEPKYKHCKFLRRHLLDYDSSMRKQAIARTKNSFWEKILEINLSFLKLDLNEIESELQNYSGDRKKVKIFLTRLKKLAELIEEENNYIKDHTELFKEIALLMEKYSDIEKIDLPDGFDKRTFKFYENLEKDITLMRKIAANLENFISEPLGVKILGIGEITTTIEIVGGKNRGLYDKRSGRKFHYAVKKLPPFPTEERAKIYGVLFDEYQTILRDAGLNLPPWGWWAKKADDGRVVVYAYQEKLDTKANCALLIKIISNEDIRRLFKLMLKNAKCVFDFNRAGKGVSLGFDAQLPNWIIADYDPAKKTITGEETLQYIDTSTPMMRKGGPDLLDTEIFLKTIPAPLRPIVRGTIMQEVLDRYYSPRDVITDIVASFYLYERPDMVPALVEDANEFLRSEMAEYGLKAFTVKEMEKYHRNDTMIWVFFRAIKRLDRFIKQKIFGKPYEQRLPNKKFRPGPFQS